LADAGTLSEVATEPDIDVYNFSKNVFYAILLKVTVQEPEQKRCQLKIFKTCLRAARTDRQA